MNNPMEIASPSARSAAGPSSGTPSLSAYAAKRCVRRTYNDHDPHSPAPEPASPELERRAKEGDKFEDIAGRSVAPDILVRLSDGWVPVDVKHHLALTSSRS